MNAKEVVDKIVGEAKAEAEGIIAEAKNRLAEERKRFDSKMESFNKDTETLANDAAEEKKSRMLATARMDMKKEYVQAKSELLAEVFEKAKEKIKSLPDDQYVALVSGLMTKIVETGDEEVVVGSGESRINDNLIKNVNRQLGPGFKGNLRLAADKADIDGGFILRRGKIQINVSTDVMVSQAREVLEMELATELFG